MADNQMETLNERQIGALVRERAGRYAAPAGLAGRIGGALDGAIDPHRQRSRRPLALAASILLAVVLSSGGTWFLAGTRQQDDLAEQLVASHVRSMLGEHLTDVASSDQHTVKPWFGGRIDLSPPVTDFTTQGFPLVGGRLDYVDRRPVAALVYRHNQHIINVFVWTEEKTFTPPAPKALQGYNLRHWRDDGLAFWAVSDVAPADLEKFERVIRTASR